MHVFGKRSITIGQVMRVCFDGDVFKWQRIGGISRIYLELLPRLTRLDHSLHITVAVQGPVRPETLKILAPWYKAIPYISAEWWPWQFWRVVRLFVNQWLWNTCWLSFRPDVFLSTYYTVSTVRVPRVCVVYDLGVELFGHFFPPEWVKAELQRKENTIRNADTFICISKSTLKDLLRIYGVDERRCRVIHLAGFSREVLDDVGMQNPVPESRFLLYVGEYRSRYKNFKFMLQALAGTAKLDGCDLVVVSALVPTSDEVRSFADISGGRHIRFENNCDDDRLKALYASCEVFIYPSLYEGFGIPVLEALACGAPVVCSDTSSMPEVGGAVVCYFDPTSESSFRVALAGALTEGREPAKMEARKRQAATFSWDRTAEEFLEVLRESGGSSVGEKC